MQAKIWGLVGVMWMLLIATVYCLVHFRSLGTVLCAGGVVVVVTAVFWYFASWLAIGRKRER